MKSILRLTLTTLSFTTAAPAATIGGDPVPNTPAVAAVPPSGDDPGSPAVPAAGGIGYKFSVAMSGNDTATGTSFVGAWSWEDQALFTAGQDAAGWTHTSNWFAISLTQPAVFTLQLAAEAGVSRPISGNPENIAGTDHMFPSFTIFSGWDGDGADNHVWNNDGVLGSDPLDNAAKNWFEDISYLDHLNNSTLSSVTHSWTLAAGNYTITVGSNSSSETRPADQGYRFTFTTVPEPGSFALLALTGLAALRRRR